MLGATRGFGGYVERKVAGAVEDEEPMLTRKGGVSGSNVELQEAELSWVMCLGSVVDRGRTERLRQMSMRMLRINNQR